MFQADQGGQCSWNEMTKGKEVREEFGEVYGKIVQDIVDQWNNTDFTLSEMRKPLEGFKQRSEGIWLTLATELFTASQVRDCGSLDQGGSGGNGDKCWDSGFILKKELIGFTNWSDYERPWTIWSRRTERSQG